MSKLTNRPFYQLWQGSILTSFVLKDVMGSSGSKLNMYLPLGIPNSCLKTIELKMVALLIKRV